MKRKGFTLVEIMIVVLVICLLAAVAIPNLLRARVSGQETNAATNLNSVALAEIQRRSLSGLFTNLATLASENYIDSLLGAGTKQGYSYSVNLPGGGTNQFYACAVGQGHSFYIDQRGNLCRSVNAGQNCPGSSLSGSCTGQWAGLVESSGGGGGGAVPAGKASATTSQGGAQMGLE